MSFFVQRPCIDELVVFTLFSLDTSVYFDILFPYSGRSDVSIIRIPATDMATFQTLKGALWPLACKLLSVNSKTESNILRFELKPCKAG